MRVGIHDRIINGMAEICFRQTGQRTETGPTVQTSPETQVGGMLGEKLVQLSGNRRNSGAAGTQGTLGEELMQLSGTERNSGTIGTEAGIPRKSVAISVVAQVAISITAVSLPDG